MSINEERLKEWIEQVTKKLAHLEANQIAIINGDFCDTDTAPQEPLIKDEKIRKAVRAWAEAEGETQVQVTHCRKHILSIWSATKENGNIDFDCDIEPFDEGFYSIAELCGTPEPVEPTFIDLDERIKEKREE